MIQAKLAHLFREEVRVARPSPIREICSLVARPEVCSLAGGWPAPETFPTREIAGLLTALLQTGGEQLLQYGSTEGLLELRLALLERLKSEAIKGLGPENILITHGSTQGIHLAVQVFVDKGDVILVGLPTYFGATGAFLNQGGEPVGVAVDDRGLDTEALAQKAQQLKAEGRRVKAVYVIPNFQNPTGATLTLERRKHLLELARQFDLVILEDDPYGDLRYEGQKIDSLLALDTEGRVVQLRSLSKTFCPGLRLAWAAGPAEVIRKMVVTKQYSDCATNSLVQHLLLGFIRQGLWEERIKQNIEYYRTKRDFMLAMLERYFPSEATWNRPEGGFFIFVRLPPAWDASLLLQKAIEQNVAFVTGQPFFVDGGGRNTFRLSFSQADKSSIETAIKKLGEALKKMAARGRLSYLGRKQASSHGRPEASN
ncbi:MAG: PLP-dependent aminotransferase family protein [Thermodesulfobacteriota bacterium]